MRLWTAVPGGRCSCPLGLIGMLALIGIARCFGVPQAQIPAPAGRVEMCWQDSARAARSLEAGSDILCFGDSVIKLGILPRVLKDRLGVSAYNLGVLGGQAPTSYFLLQRVLERGIRPRAILINFSENLLAGSPAASAARWANSVGWRESLDVAWHSKDPAVGVSSAFHGLFPGWCDERGWSPFLTFGAHKKSGTVSADDPRVFERNWRLNRGAQAAPRQFVPVEGTTTTDCARWRPDPANEAYVDRLLRTAMTSRTPVFWLLPPSMREQPERPDRAGVSESYRRFVAARVAEFSCLTVLDGESLQWSARVFRDPLHLNRDGAVRFSLAVADAVAPRLLGHASVERWIDVVATSEQEAIPYQNLVEDLDQSRAAIEPILVGQRFAEAKPW
jgi:hypothetical protein